MAAINEVLRNAREKAELTQQELALKAGVSRAYYADVERGRYNPSLSLLVRLSEILKIDLNFLKKNDGNTSKY
ncbi:helix-turn-helix transcriptional regulator [Acidaminococcus massiliensis]|uniref:helix-turn-helix transcriptional regulator n=1 Tax=Acidaminococcus massiliensis TaxID=1852375 RepID=UPI003521204F